MREILKNHRNEMFWCRYRTDCQTCMLVQMGEKANYHDLPCEECGRKQRQVYLWRMKCLINILWFQVSLWFVIYQAFLNFSILCCSVLIIFHKTIIFVNTCDFVPFLFIHSNWLTTVVRDMMETHCLLFQRID